MAFYQVDSSALVKRYVAERGSAWVRSIAAVGTRNRLGLARVTIVEVASALTRKHREGEIGRQDRDVAMDVFLNDCRQEYQVLEIGPALVERAVALTQVHPLRAYDAVQPCRRADRTRAAGCQRAPAGHLHLGGCSALRPRRRGGPAGGEPERSPVRRAPASRTHGPWPCRPCATA